MTKPITTADYINAVGAGCDARTRAALAAMAPEVCANINAEDQTMTPADMLINLDTVRVHLSELPLRQAVWTGSLEDFVRDNEMTDDTDEILAICEALADAGQYYGGGGAGPEWMLRIV